MCLVINTNIHGSVFPQPKIAKVPLLVWKSLEQGTQSGGLSPFRYHYWAFGCTEKATLSKTAFGEIKEGLHAHVLSYAQRKNKELVRRYTTIDAELWEIYGRLYPAMIPAGTKFYVGTRGDIVSETLTVYHSLSQMYRKLGITELAPGISHETITKDW